MDISLDLYKHFYVVSKYKNMTKAAEELMISQPAISKSIKQLELQIGSPLFNRSSRGLELTAEGEMLYNRIKPALELIQNAENELQEYQVLNTGEIKIGISSVLTKCLLLDTLASFKLKYPNIKISIINGLTSSLIKDLNEGKIDFVIYNEADSIPKNVDIEDLTSLKYTFFYNPLYYDLNEIKKIEELKNYPLIIQSKESNARQFFDKYTKNMFEPYMEVMSQDLICQLVEKGLGIGVAFDKLIDLNYSNLRKFPISTAPASNIKIAKNKGLKSSFASKTFIKELKNNL